MTPRLVAVSGEDDPIGRSRWAAHPTTDPTPVSAHRRRPIPILRGRRWLLLLAAMLLLIAGTAIWVLWPNQPTRWVDGSQHGMWMAVYDGYGRTTAQQERNPPVVSLSPKAASRPDETHAGLVVSVSSFADLAYSVELRTVHQLRTPTPRPWEVGWVLWRYTDPTHFYALTLKPNGWELSKQDPAYPGGQRFLASGDSPGFAVGRWYHILVVQTGNTIVATVDDQPLVRFTDTERPYAQGRVGLYCEDAHVLFRQPQITALPTTQPTTP